MARQVYLLLNGALALNQPQRDSLVKWIRFGLEPLVKKARKILHIKLVDHPKQLVAPPDTASTFHLQLNFQTEEIPEKKCGLVLAECNTGEISITKIRYMGVCGLDPNTRNRPFLTTDELLGHALANTALHELGHLIGNFDDNRENGNYMSTLGPRRSARRKSSGSGGPGCRGGPLSNLRSLLRTSRRGSRRENSR